MSEFFSGKELMEKWGLRDFELFRFVSEGKLRPCDSIGQLIAHPYYRDSERMTYLRSIVSFEDTESLSSTKNIKTEDEGNLPASGLLAFLEGLNAVGKGFMEMQKASELLNAEYASDKFPGWYKSTLPTDEKQAKGILKVVVESLYHNNDLIAVDAESGVNTGNVIESSNTSGSKNKKLRSNQIHKTLCREIAKKLWDEDPSITIADMIWGNEIAEACDGKDYAERTLRNWIKDLCPNRSPGRRPLN